MLVLVLIEEEMLRADGTVVATDIIEPPIVASEWSLSALVLSYPKLMRSQSLLQSLSIVLIIVVNESLESLNIFEDARFLV